MAEKIYCINILSLVLTKHNKIDNEMKHQKINWILLI